MSYFESRILVGRLSPKIFSFFVFRFSFFVFRFSFFDFLSIFVFRFSFLDFVVWFRFSIVAFRDFVFRLPTFCGDNPVHDKRMLSQPRYSIFLLESTLDHSVGVITEEVEDFVCLMRCSCKVVMIMIIEEEILILKKLVQIWLTDWLNFFVRFSFFDFVLPEGKKMRFQTCFILKNAKQAFWHIFIFTKCKQTSVLLLFCF